MRSEHLHLVEPQDVVEPVTRSVPGRELRRTLARGDEQRGREQRGDEGRDPVGSHGRSCYVQNDRGARRDIARRVRSHA